MNNFQIVLLSMALVFNSWLFNLNSGVALSGETFKNKFSYTVIMFLVQLVMAGAGIWIGYKNGSLEVKVNMAISLSIMFIFGLKVLLTGIRMQTEEITFDFTDQKVTFFAALAEGITPLAIGVSIGLLSVHPYLHWIIVGMFLLSGILTALVLARRMGIASFKLRLGPIGGLFLLAAAIKLAISLTGF
jgi:putative Mn2+ efflux pump MntP